MFQISRRKAFAKIGYIPFFYSFFNNSSAIDSDNFRSDVESLKLSALGNGIPFFSFLTEDQKYHAQNRTGKFDFTDLLNRAAETCSKLNKTLFINDGEYITSNTITFENVSVEFENALTTKILPNSNFVAIKIIGTRRFFRNFNVWYTNFPVSEDAIAFQFGEKKNAFNRNVVQNFYSRYAYIGFYCDADVWGNEFDQLNSDFTAGIAFKFTANPSGTTNSFRNIYGQGTQTTGSIKQNSNLLVVKDARNYRVGGNVVVCGAGGGEGALVSSIKSVIGNNVTLDSAASTTVTNSPVALDVRGWISAGFSDLHLFNVYFDSVVATGQGQNSAVFFADSSVFIPSSIRFESCLVVQKNAALIDNRSNYSQIEAVLIFACIFDVGFNNYGFLYVAGNGKNTRQRLGDIHLEFIDLFSGGIKKVLNKDDMSLLINGLTITHSDIVNSKNENESFASNSANKVISQDKNPISGSWDLYSEYKYITSDGRVLRGICNSPGSFAELGKLVISGKKGNAKINSLEADKFKQNTFIQFEGYGDIFKVVGINTKHNEVILSKILPFNLNNVAVKVPKPFFVLY